MGLKGRYQVIKKIADGGMAEIFLATQAGAEGFERTVILKRILPVFSMDPQFRHMIVDEAHIAMSLTHGNVVQVLDLGESGGRSFLVMELVDGWDIATVLDRARAARFKLPPGLALHVVAQICRALAYAHGKTRDGQPLGIVHRDISPQNVLVSEHGEVKLTDFGIAKALGKRERTQAGVIKGKLDFMSPEQAAGTTIDGRSDIFSVGTLLYLLTTDRLPFDAPTDLDTLVRIQNADFPPPREVTRGLAPEIAAIIEKAMRKLPSQRYASAEQMMLDVEEALRERFSFVGQSELARWLDELRRKDGAPTISQTPGIPLDPSDEEETAPQGKRGPGARDAQDTETTAAVADTMQALPVETGGLPTATIDEDATEYVGRVRARRSGLGGAAVVAGLGALLGGGALGALWLASPVTARKLVGAGERLWDDARTDSEATRARRGSRPPEPEPPPRREPARVAEQPAPRAEPQPERPAKSVVTVSLRTRPAGAQVRTRSGVAGTTPLALSLRPGTVQRLTFAKRGYARTTRKIVVGSTNQSILVELSRPARRSARR